MEMLEEKDPGRSKNIGAYSFIGTCRGEDMTLKEVQPKQGSCYIPGLPIHYA
jgi:hypothetical protein